MIPGKLTGSNPLARWLNQLRDSVAEAQITSILGGRMNKGAGGTQLIVEPGNGAGSTVRMFHLKSVQGDYITCKSWNGTDEGDADVYIAKPYRLRESLTTESGGIAGGGYDFSYSGSAPNRVRSKNNGTDSESEVVIPIWLVDEVIYAISATTGVNTDGDVPITLLMLSDGRAWAKVTA